MGPKARSYSGAPRRREHYRERPLQLSERAMMEELTKDQEEMLSAQRERVVRAASRWAEASLFGAFLDDDGKTWLAPMPADCEERIKLLHEEILREAKALVTMRALYSRTQEPGKLKW